MRVAFDCKLQELPLLPIIIFTLSFCSVWTVDAFVDSDDAEAALCANRTAFVQRDVKTSIPSHIWKQIVHPGDIAQITGFQELFLILNTNPAADGLRQLVVDYFNDSPPLRAHLSESRFILWIMRHRFGDSCASHTLEQPGAAPPPFFSSSPPKEGHLSKLPLTFRKFPLWRWFLEHGQKDARNTPKSSALAPLSSVDVRDGRAARTPAAQQASIPSQERQLASSHSYAASHPRTTSSRPHGRRAYSSGDGSAPQRSGAANGWESPRARSFGHNASLTSSRPHGRRAISLSGDGSAPPRLGAANGRESPRAHSYSRVALPTSSRPHLRRAISFAGRDSATSRAVPSPPRLRRAVSAGSAPQPLGAVDSSNPVLEMRRGSLLGVEKVLHQFSEMNRTIRVFCERSSDFIGESTRVPRMTLALPEHSPVGKPAYEFSSSEDYVFFTLLSIINTHLHDNIFRPFHPAASAQESDRYEELYLKIINTCKFVTHFSLASSDV